MEGRGATGKLGLGKRVPWTGTGTGTGPGSAPRPTRQCAMYLPPNTRKNNIYFPRARAPLVGCTHQLTAGTLTPPPSAAPAAPTRRRHTYAACLSSAPPRPPLPPPPRIHYNTFNFSSRAVGAPVLSVHGHGQGSALAAPTARADADM